MLRSFAVLVPAYNEAENIPDLIQELKECFERYALQGEVILVDDGSTDDTYQLALKEAASWDRLRVLQHRGNRGKTEAIVTAFQESDAAAFVLFDADLQHRVDEIPRFLEKIGEGWDIVTGKKIGFYEKRLVSSIYNQMSRSLFDVPVTDLNSMKAFRREVLEEIHLRHDWHRFFVVLAFAKGFRVTEIEIELLPRRHGTSKYTGQTRIWKGLLDMVAVWFALGFQERPMILFGMTGLGSFGASVLVACLTVFLRLLGWPSPIGYRPLLLLVILLMMMGALLFGVGLVAEMMANLRSETQSLRSEVRRLHTRSREN